LHGMQEVGGSIPPGSTTPGVAGRAIRHCNDGGPPGICEKTSLMFNAVDDALLTFGKKRR
jgi:hypothetical protein